MVIDVVDLIKKEYGRSLLKVARSFVKDDFTHDTVAKILHVEPRAFKEFCFTHSIKYKTQYSEKTKSTSARAKMAQSHRARKQSAITFKGKTLTYAEWADITGIPRDTIRMRINRGYSPQGALTCPVERARRRT